MNGDIEINNLDNDSINKASSEIVNKQQEGPNTPNETESFRIVPSRTPNPCWWDVNDRNEYGRIKVHFDLGSIHNHPQWGSFDNVQHNKCSFVLDEGKEEGEFHLPVMDNIQPYIDDVTEWWLGLGPDPSPAYTFMNVGISATYSYIFVGRIIDVTSEAMKLIAMEAILATGLDDFIDLGDTLGDDKLKQSFDDKVEFTKRFQNWCDLEDQILKGAITELPEDFIEEFPYGKKLHLGFVDFVKHAKEYIQKKGFRSFEDLSKWFGRAKLGAYDAEVIEWICGIKKNFDSETNRVFRVQNVMQEPFMAVFCLMAGYLVPQRLMNTFLWKRLNETANFIISGFNSVYGLTRDIKLNLDNNDVLILAKEMGIPLAEAMDVFLENMEEERRNLRSVCRAILELYPGDKDVEGLVMVYLCCDHCHPHFVNAMGKFNRYGFHPDNEKSGLYKIEDKI